MILGSDPNDLIAPRAGAQPSFQRSMPHNSELPDQINELAALPDMSAVELRTEWRRLHKRPAPDFSPDLMARVIAHELQARRFGGLSRAARKALDWLG